MQTDENQAPRRPTILLVDDEAMVLEVGKAILERLGHAVITAESGEQALLLFGRHKEAIGCVVLDLTMPGMDGEAVYGQIRAQAPTLPVVIASGMSAEQLSDQFKETAATAVLQKPYQVANLSATIQTLLDA